MINLDGTHNARYTVYLGDWIVTQSMVTLGQAGHDRQAGSTALMIIPLLIMFLSCCFLFLFFGIKKKKVENLGWANTGNSEPSLQP